MLTKALANVCKANGCSIPAYSAEDRRCKEQQLSVQEQEEERRAQKPQTVEYDARLSGPHLRIHNLFCVCGARAEFMAAVAAHGPRWVDEKAARATLDGHDGLLSRSDGGQLVAVRPRVEMAMQPGRGFAEGLATDLVMDDASDPEQASSIEFPRLLVPGKVEHELFERWPNLLDRSVGFDGACEVSKEGLRIVVVASIGRERHRLLVENLSADGISVEGLFTKCDACKCFGVVARCELAIPLRPNVGQSLSKEIGVVDPAGASEEIRVACQG
jgi:hypothetical protein